MRRLTGSMADAGHGDELLVDADAQMERFLEQLAHVGRAVRALEAAVQLAIDVNDVDVGDHLFNRHVGLEPATNVLLHTNWHLDLGSALYSVSLEERQPGPAPAARQAVELPNALAHPRHLRQGGTRGAEHDLEDDPEVRQPVFPELLRFSDVQHRECGRGDARGDVQGVGERCGKVGGSNVLETVLQIQDVQPGDEAVDLGSRWVDCVQVLRTMWVDDQLPVRADSDERPHFALDKELLTHALAPKRRVLVVEDEQHLLRSVCLRKACDGHNEVDDQFPSFVLRVPRVNHLHLRVRQLVVQLQCVDGLQELGRTPLIAILVHAADVHVAAQLTLRDIGGGPDPVGDRRVQGHRSGTQVHIRLVDYDVVPPQPVGLRQLQSSTHQQLVVVGVCWVCHNSEGEILRLLLAERRQLPTRIHAEVPLVSRLEDGRELWREFVTQGIVIPDPLLDDEDAPLVVNASLDHSVRGQGNRTKPIAVLTTGYVVNPQPYGVPVPQGLPVGPAIQPRNSVPKRQDFRVSVYTQAGSDFEVNTNHLACWNWVK
mmetsp:Transcript_127304/g.407521  ORF Transcript_127304/g.407521 Transcript_127304/m.407521 type:complete len:543 (-) Transcript_127304:407-2035(-)